MFTDTKNLDNNCINYNSYQKSRSSNSKNKIRRFLKLLIRLNSKKVYNTDIVCRANANESHPNNINLNNMTSITNPKDATDNTNAALIDYIGAICKETGYTELELPEHRHRNDASSVSTDDHNAIISSASIEKLPLAICMGCSHGRNCQHSVYHPNWDNGRQSTVPELNENFMETESAYLYERLSGLLSGLLWHPTDDQHFVVNG